MPYLADPGVGIVQSPQCFDTDESMGWIQRAGMLPSADGATVGPRTEPGHPMRVQHVAVSIRDGATRS